MKRRINLAEAKGTFPMGSKIPEPLKVEMADLLPMIEKLKTALKEMLREHKAIIAALTAFADAARKENKLGDVRFADKLILHARMEEEIIYPTAILIGEYVKLKLCL